MAILITNPACYLRLSAKVNFDNKSVEVGVLPFNSKADYQSNNVVPYLGQMLKINPTYTYQYNEETPDILLFAHRKLMEDLSTDQVQPKMVNTGTNLMPVMTQDGTEITRPKICEPSAISIDLVQP